MIMYFSDIIVAPVYKAFSFVSCTILSYMVTQLTHTNRVEEVLLVFPFYKQKGKRDEVMCPSHYKNVE